jgi:adenine-specific DNA-methyltransferase
MSKTTSTDQDGVKQYTHEDKKRVNNPPVGLVTAETDHLNGKKTYQFDPHLDPQLQWAGKAEGVSLEVDTVSLHVHERIDPLTIIEAVRKKELQEQQTLFHYFETKENNPPIREAIEFYKHSQGWSNRLIAGDSLLVMNSLLEKEGMAGKVQMIYIDPPYGIKYGSNFQPFVNKRDVKDGKDEDLTQEPEMIKAFRDTWELGIHSYLAYLRNRLLLAQELLHESGSVFVQISDENIHLVRCLMDEVFGVGNFVSQITFQKTGGISSNLLGTTVDYLLWYAKERSLCKYHQLYLPRQSGDTSLDRYDQVELKNGEVRRITQEEQITGILPDGAKRFQLAPLYSEGEGSVQEFAFEGKSYTLRPGTHWKTTPEGLVRLAKVGRIAIMGNVIRYKRYADDFKVVPITDRWESTQIGTQRVYVVQTANSVIQRCVLMTKPRRPPSSTQPAAQAPQLTWQNSGDDAG